MVLIRPRRPKAQRAINTLDLAMRLCRTRHGLPDIAGRIACWRCNLEATNIVKGYKPGDDVIPIAERFKILSDLSREWDLV